MWWAWPALVRSGSHSLGGGCRTGRCPQARTSKRSKETLSGLDPDRCPGRLRCSWACDWRTEGIPGYGLLARADSWPDRTRDHGSAGTHDRASLRAAFGPRGGPSRRHFLDSPSARSGTSQLLRSVSGLAFRPFLCAHVECMTTSPSFSVRVSLPRLKLHRYKRNASRLSRSSRKQPNLSAAISALRAESIDGAIPPRHHCRIRHAPARLHYPYRSCGDAVARMTLNPNTLNKGPKSTWSSGNGTLTVDEPSGKSNRRASTKLIERQELEVVSRLEASAPSTNPNEHRSTSCVAFILAMRLADRGDAELSRPSNMEPTTNHRRSVAQLEQHPRANAIFRDHTHAILSHSGRPHLNGRPGSTS